VSAALSTILEKLGGGLLAVRSSCTSEDLDNSSFAGQYETVLGVKGRAELEDAVKACWLSMFGTRAIQYSRVRNSAGKDAGMAVLVQKLIRAYSAGVAFSVNPVTGVREVVVNAIRGLGDRLVSGTATPDYWVVGDRATCVSRVENSISEEEALQIADLAKKVESHFGAPQDIEWAISGGRLFLLQARPITTVAKRASVGPSARRVEPVPIPIVVPEGHWTIDRDHWPMPASPMVVSFALKDVNAWLKQMTEDLGLPLDGIEFRLIGGWWYVRIVPPGGKDRRPPPEWLLRILVRVAPSMRRRVEKMKEAVRSDLMGKYGEAWRNEWRPEYIRRRNELVAVDLKAISDEQLYSHLSAVLDYNRYVMEIHFRYIHPISFDLGYFGVLCQDHLKWDSQRTLNLLGGLSSSDSEPGRRMAALANHARANPSLAAAIKQSIRTGSLEDALSADSFFSKEFRAYLNDFGGATTGYDWSYPTLAEMPVELLRLIDAQMSMSYDPSKVSLELQRRRAAGEEEIDRSDLPGELKSKVKSSLARARNSYGILDEETFYGLISQGIVRGTLLEVGSRLAAKGVIENRDDIFMLTLDEAREALLKGGNRVQLVNKRLGERMWAIANPGPASYGKAPPPPPSPSVFPAQAQRFMRAVMWTLGLTILGRLPAGDGRQLTGTPASPGRYEGICRVVKDETEFEKIQPGDVLVCVSTTPSWSAVLSVIGALVTEAGGVLSHPAIVAREYGIPAVLSLERATEKLRDGQRVRVDGDLGAVTLVEGEVS
jgi:pyruvate,water dikinase